MWTRFYDMHSGGGRKLEWEIIYIEAPFDEAKAVFQNRFGRDPDHETCNCCGNDYSVGSDEELSQVTGFERNCADSGHRYIERQKYESRPYVTIEELIEQRHDSFGNLVHFIFAEDIEPSERALA